MRNIILSTLLVLIGLHIFPMALFGQSASPSLGGNVYGSDKQAITGATILLIKEGEADFSMGVTTTSDGSFIFRDVPIGEYTLKVSFIGYKKAELQITVADKEQMNVNVYLEEGEISLSEIVITANTIEKFADKTIFRLTDTDRKSFSNALTLLQVVPKLQVMDLSLTTINGKAVKY